MENNIFNSFKKKEATFPPPPKHFSTEFVQVTLKYRNSIKWVRLFMVQTNLSVKLYDELFKTFETAEENNEYQSCPLFFVVVVNKVILRAGNKYTHLNENKHHPLVLF